MLRLQNNITKLGDLKTDAFERYHHTYPASYIHCKPIALKIVSNEALVE